VLLAALIVISNGDREDRDGPAPDDPRRRPPPGDRRGEEPGEPAGPGEAVAPGGAGEAPVPGKPGAPEAPGPAAPAGTPGPGRAVVGEPALVEVRVSRLEATPVWTWTDRRSWDSVVFRIHARAWDPVAGRFGDETVVSEDRLDDADAIAAGATVRVSATFRAPRAGLYSFRVQVEARRRVITPARGAEHEASWQASQAEKVMIGAEGWSVVPLPGVRGDLLHDATEPRLAFFFELYRGAGLVRDCALGLRFRWPARVHAVDCDWDTGERSVMLDNPAPGTAGTWPLAIARPDDPRPFAHVELESVFRTRRG
jgi:hypothetical protein